MLFGLLTAKCRTDGGRKEEEESECGIRLFSLNSGRCVSALKYNENVYVCTVFSDGTLSRLIAIPGVDSLCMYKGCYESRVLNQKNITITSKNSR